MLIGLVELMGFTGLMGFRGFTGIKFIVPITSSELLELLSFIALNQNA